jgi:hypothetical protein
MPDLNLRLAFIIAHYDPNGRVSSDLYNFVMYISRLSNKIIFVSTRICESEINKLSPYATVISRENFGYDFWSYKTGLEALGELKDIERLVFFNNSFITTDPQSLCNFFLGPIKGKALRGLTVAHYPKLHVQSYLFAFEDSSLINSTEFKNWWRNMTPISNKDEVIHLYEIGMSEWFIQWGTPIKSAFTIPMKDIPVVIVRVAMKMNWKPSHVLRKLKLLKRQLNSKIKIHENLNPTHYFWLSLYLKSKIIKIDLLKNNPTNQDLSKLFNHIDPASLELIKEATRNSYAFKP